ncbi:hypothetical protein Vafri_20853 [Volvox africanus]|uniref:Uncharacterized protein n=1 Tax=Volvox africanus TaxID=51714 RepID=A0A8J4BT33_9CHLO|nr:hypothetical protein Vafri_20853 [Volvox africanus]
MEKWIVGTRLDFAPGPTAWHGLSVADFPTLEMAWCLMTAFILFFFHWGIYRFFVHGLQSTQLRCCLALALATSYVSAIPYLHPLRPYWIRELSALQSQLFAWKVLEMALYRGQQPLLDGFWRFLLFDVLILRPEKLILPDHWNVAIQLPRASAPARLSDGSGDGSAGDPRPQHQIDGLQPPPSSEDQRRNSDECTTENAQERHLAEFCIKPGVVTQQACLTEAETVEAAGGRVNASDRCDSAVQQQASCTVSCITQGGNNGIGDGSSGCSSCSSSSSSGITRGTTGSEGGCSMGGDGCNDGGQDNAAMRRGAIARLVAISKAVVVRLRMAGAKSWGPMLDFLSAYIGCEAINAYLMHRRAEDILEAPLPVQAWLCACFATTLYLHLNYFFYATEMLWIMGFALVCGCQVDRWEPLFDSPGKSTSPSDLWKKRYAVRLCPTCKH